MKEYIKVKKIFASITIPVMVFAMYMIDIWNINEVNAVKVPAKSTISDDFPASYKSYVDALRKAHPNWEIKALYNHLDWNTAVDSESSGTYSRVQDSAFSDAWKRVECKDQSSYNAGGFVLASRQAVAYTMDPRNFLTEKAIFQFRVVDKNIDSDTENIVNETMSGKPMKDTDYAKIIVNAGKNTGVSPLFLVSRIRQETGCDIINNGSINGRNDTYTGYYNFFNIGAYDSASKSQTTGLAAAKTNGWNTPEKAIKGGTEWLYRNYIKYGQYNVYLQKFDVANPYGNATTILSMQYMSNISAPEGEAKIAYDGLVKANALDNKFTFYIPVYDNMPDTPAAYPGTVEDNTIVFVSESVENDGLNVRSGPGTDYSIITNLPAGTQMTRIQKSQNSQWDIVKLSDGRIGYVFREYLKEGTTISSISLNKSEITLNKNETYKIEYTVAPSNATNKEVTFSSSNENVAIVSNGLITAKSSGEATITVKAKYGNASTTLKVKVNVNVESISMDKDTYTLIKGKKRVITPVIKPDNATNKDYDITSDNESIVKVDGKNLVGVSDGEANITYTTKDQGKKVTFKVKVITVSQEELQNFDQDKITVNENDSYISKIEPGTKASDVISKISYNKDRFTLKLLDAKGNELANDAVVGTGTTTNLVTKDTNEIVETYTVVIYGDLNGDGDINTVDLLSLQKYVLNLKSFDTLQLKVGNLSKDGNTPNIVDVLKLQKHILNISKISQ